MTSSQIFLRSAGGDYCGSFLQSLERVLRSFFQFTQVVGPLGKHGVSLASGPQIFDETELGSAGRQESNLNRTAKTVEVVAHAVVTVSPDFALDSPARVA